MSTDLDLHLNFHIPAIVDRKVLSSSTNHSNTSVVLIDNLSSDQQQQQQQKLHPANNKVAKKMKPIAGDTAEENPLTPTLEENKIPAPRSPPPAPRKRRCGVVIACRKKLDFLEQHPQLIIPKEEAIEEFFNSSFEQINSRRLLKRRCPCV